MAIDHYSKWWEARLVKEQTAEIIAKFLEKEIIYRFRVPKYILTDNGRKWMTKFDMMCKHFGITHQFTTLEWPSCNGMVERMIKTLKHGFLVVYSSNI
jgi:hypothetical protein